MKKVYKYVAALAAFGLGVIIATAYSVYFLKAVKIKDVPPSNQHTSYPGLSKQIAVMGKLMFFPPYTFSSDEKMNQFKVDWYSKHLAAMGEESLYMSADFEEGYRFLWLRSFDSPLCILISRVGETRLLSVTQLGGAGGYAPGEVVINHKRKLSRQEWDKLVRLVEQASYWQMPTVEQRLGTDGAQWILEGVKEGRYHIVDRWSPDNGGYRELCLSLLEASGLRINLVGEYVH